MRIKKTTIAIPTYAWGKEDPEPPFLREFTPRNQPIYPYSIKEIIETEKCSRDYEAIIFENDYLKVTFLPELNGRIYSAIDKVNQKEMFYSNPVIKPSLLGLRGAWAAVGVEYNFPNSHSTTTLERIPYCIREHEDGSASFICGNHERLSGMDWSVEVVLRPNESSLKMVSRLQNATEFPHRYYYWINAAVPAYPESRYIYPPSTHRLYTHPPMDISSLGYIKYPIHQGRDISLYKNITRHFPVFVETMKEDFFGIYHHDQDCGLVHVADHSLVRGRKLWMFGNAQDGKVWLNRLTGNGVDYCELQTGPFTLQSDYRMLQPGQTHIQYDTWYPVGNLGGFNAASETLAANANVEKTGKIVLKLNATRCVQNAEIVVRDQSQNIIDSKKCSLLPMAIQRIEFVLPSDMSTDDMTVEILEEGGNHILEYVHAPRKGKNECDSPEAYVSELNRSHQKAYYNELQGHDDKAMNLYREDSSRNLDSKIAIGRLKAKQGRYRDALEDLLKAVRVEYSHAEGHYYAGVCYRKMGKYDQAEEHLSHAMDDAYWARNVLYQLALTAIGRNRYSIALTRLKQLAAHHTASSRILAYCAMVLRKTGSEDQALHNLQNGRKHFEFDPLVSGELFLLQKNLITGLSITYCWNDQQLLDILRLYLDVCQYTDAEKIVLFYLNRRKDNAVNPLIYYYLGYIQSRLNKMDESIKAIETAKEGTGTWEGASRIETESVLRTTLEIIPKDSTALLQLGNLLASRGRWDEAVEYWRNVTGQYRTCALRAEGLYWWKIRQNPQASLTLFKSASESDHCGAKTIWEYDHLLEELGRHDERLKVLEMKNNVVAGDNRLLLRQVSAFIATKHPRQGLDILMKHDFTLCEGKILPRILYENACSQLADELLQEGNYIGAYDYYRKLLEYPVNLGVGKPAFNYEARWWWYCGKLLKLNGDIEGAKQHFRNGSQDGEGIAIDFFPLRNIVLQHSTDTIDLLFWKNEFFKALCSYENQEKDIFEQRMGKIKKYIDRLVEDGRGDEEPVHFIRNLFQQNQRMNSSEIPISILSPAENNL